MENFPKCPQCFSDNPKYAFSPFCSDRCEILTHDYSPISMINSIYQEFKHSKTSKKSTEDKDAELISCKSCDKQVDYDFMDTQVDYFCSSHCVDYFIDSDGFNGSSIVFNNVILNVSNDKPL